MMQKTARATSPPGIAVDKIRVNGGQPGPFRTAGILTSVWSIVR